MDIFVRNISERVEESDLKAVFEPFGRVDRVMLVTDKETGRRVGFGFVSMPDQGEAVSAVNGLKGVELKGKVLEFHDSRARFERRQNPDRRGAPRHSPERRRGDRRG